MLVVMAAIVGQEASGKTRGPVAAAEGVLTSSIRKAVTVAIMKPVTTPLLEWAKAAAEKAREERRSWKEQQTSLGEEAVSDFEFSRDRD